MWLILATFLAAFLVSVLAALSARYIQKRPWPIPTLIMATGTMDLVFSIAYARLVVPQFPGSTTITADVRGPLWLVAITALIFPFAIYFASEKQLRMERASSELLASERQVAQEQLASERQVAQEQLASEKQVAQLTVSRLQDQLRTAGLRNDEQHRQLAELKRLIISNVSHELKTPLAIALGYASMILDGTFGEVATHLHEPISTVHLSTRRMNAVVERMVNTWREPSLQPTDIATIGRQALSDPDIWLNVRRDPAEISLTSDIPDHLFVIGDTEMLRTALVQLLNNAIKFGSTQVDLAMYEEDGEIVSRVRDNGIGISRKYQRDIFEPLYQVRMDTKRPFEGAGMGLAVVASVARAHDGHAYVISRLGNGAAFFFVIPANRSGVPPMDVTPGAED
jgi:signal transduction histidine kinase